MFDGGGLSTLAAVYGPARTIFWDLLDFCKGGRSPVHRWRRLVTAHSLNPISALSVLGVTAASAGIVRHDDELERALTVKVLQRTADRFGVRIDWLLGVDDRIYDFLLLDRSISSWIDHLITWREAGEHNTLLVLKSGRQEIDDEPSQAGALILRRTIEEIGDQVAYCYTPVYSLQSWGNDKQRWLALRAIWAAWYMGMDIFGYRTTAAKCQALADGKAFPHQSIGAGRWYPDDYVVRPTAEPQGRGWIDDIDVQHRSELFHRLSVEGHSCDRLNKFSGPQLSAEE